jgi:dipeptidyl aminopeptidase/acylaminoacyl peptidase
MTRAGGLRQILGAIGLGVVGLLSCEESEYVDRREEIQITSTKDGTEQPSYLILPKGHDAQSDPVPLVVSLHPWSANIDGGRNEDLEALVFEKGWIYLWPHFRGRNNTPEAMGSELAQQDILDAVAWTRENYPVDGERIYLTGRSGGGHMTMLMCGRYPDVWTAAVAWVGISDLAAWHDTHKDGNYGKMIRQSVGAPGESESIDAELAARSPLTHLSKARDVALHIAAGRHDGHTGSVPISHSLNAFNEIARANGTDLITEDEIAQMLRPDGHLDTPTAHDQVTDAAFGKEIFLRRQAGNAMVTVFEGGHTGIATATMDWFEGGRREK